jgi:hypothetical protein
MEEKMDEIDISFMGAFGAGIFLPVTPFTLQDRLSKDVFNLAINAAQLVLRPRFQLSPQSRVHTE